MGRGLFQPMHLLVILVIVLLIFGPGKLPEIGKGLGASIRGFKKAMSGEDDEKDAKEAPKELASPEAAQTLKQETSEEDPAKKKS